MIFYLYTVLLDSCYILHQTMDVPQKLETSENNVDVTTSKTIDSDINDDAHSVISASSSESSDDPTKYEVDSIASSVEERLTYVHLYTNNRI